MTRAVHGRDEAVAQSQLLVQQHWLLLSFQRSVAARNLGYVEFCDLQAADNARAIYNGWQGWDAKGLLIETCAPADKRMPLKRDREPGAAAKGLLAPCKDSSFLHKEEVRRRF